MTNGRIKLLKEKYHSGITVKLISMEREPQMPEGLTGKVDFVDDTGQIHVIWENGSSLALICGTDKFIALHGPTASEYLHDKLGLKDDTKTWYRSDTHNYTVDAAEAVDNNRLIHEAERFLNKNIDMVQELIISSCLPYNTEIPLEVFLSSYILTDEKVRKLKNKSDYTADESAANQCPKCGNDEIEYGTAKIEEDCIVYPWECHKCDSKGKEYGASIFDGHCVNSSSFFEEHKNCGEFNDAGQERLPVNYSIVEDDGTLISELLSNFIIGDTLDFYQSYNKETNETDGAYGVKMIRAFDSTVLIFNYYGGGAAYSIDITWDEETDRLNHIRECVHEYFNRIGFHRIYIRVKK